MYCYRGPVDCVFQSDDVLHEKKKPGNDVAKSAVVSKASSRLGVFPSVRRMRSSIVRFLVCLGTAKIKTAVLEFFVALSFKFHLLKKYK